MTGKSVVKVIVISALIILIVLPFYLFRNYLVLVYKFYKPDYSKISSEKGVVSILVLGKGGEGHTAPDLTDTIMNVYLNYHENKISLLSLPRDIWLPELRAKLNSSYYWGKKNSGSGLALASESVNSITGIKPNYVVVVDFSLFKDLIDNLGGIEVEVTNTFTDNKFPIPGKENDECPGEEKISVALKTYPCRYESLTFNKGVQQMDGETTLKFVRSRNSEGDEGTDIAREARQQQVIQSIKNKLLNRKMIFNPKKLINLYKIINSHLETNVDMESAVVLARIFFDSRNNIQTISIPENYLNISKDLKKYDYQYVFLPVGGSWIKLQEWIRNSI